ncbi:MAG: OsmC family protein [Bauldia sp.]|nr:OsmC family protein [Bauldia sp.]
MPAHEHHATIAWRLGDEDFPRGRYSRAHEWRFDGLSVPASAAPGNVPKPFARTDALDPEEAFVAALSSCHMLTFLDIARRAGFVVASYEDDAVGFLEEIAPQRRGITRVTLRPRIAWHGTPPDAARLDALHHQAHETCFIANSVTTTVTVEKPA